MTGAHHALQLGCAPGKDQDFVQWYINPALQMLWQSYYYIYNTMHTPAYACKLRGAFAQPPPHTFIDAYVTSYVCQSIFTVKHYSKHNL